MLIYLQSFIAAMGISLIGSIPLGNLNLTAMQIAVNNSRRAFLFALGVVVVEMAYLSITLWIFGIYAIPGAALFYFRIIAALLLIIMAVAGFMSVNKKSSGNIIINNKLNPIVLGIIMSAVNPMQIPFWVAWLFYLSRFAIPQPTVLGKSIFVIAAGLGTLAALLIFIGTGKKLAVLMQKNHKLVNIAIACLFLVLAVSQLIPLFQNN